MKTPQTLKPVIVTDEDDQMVQDFDTEGEALALVRTFVPRTLYAIVGVSDYLSGAR